MKESSMDSTCVNIIGAIGTWQFMEYTLKDFGYDITAKNFQNNPEIFTQKEQREALRKKINFDIKELQDQWFRKNDLNYIEKYVGKSFLDIDTVSIAGILAACHLGGVYGTIKFFDTCGEYNPSDALGTSIYTYLKYFSKYKYSINVINEIQCLKPLEEDFKNITLLLNQSKWYMENFHLPEKVIVSTSIYQKHSIRQQGQELPKHLYLLDLRHNYQNTTEEYCYLEVVRPLIMDILRVMESEKLNGTMQKNGKELYILTRDLYRLQSELDCFNFTSSRSGMRLGTSKSYIYLQNFAFKRLRNLPHLGVG
ncbi:hypothetical protein [Tenacibaculum sp.]|uniref:hypothetical protein n=1 Tax=Tenacibaculum sp. TaxID=1906242 RepID=UPI003D148F58